MEENIMTVTEEFVEAAEDNAIFEPGKAMKGWAIGIAVTAVGALAYKFIAKPIAAKIKAKKAQKAAEVAEIPKLVEVTDSTESDEE